MDSCPKELESYDKAHEKEIKRQDYLQHLWWGTYGISALSFAVEHCIFGKKAKSKFIEKPIFSEIQEKAREDIPLTEEEKRKKTEELFMQLRIMGMNHKRNHKTKDSSV